MNEDYLPLIAEECGEIVQAACKCIRFGPDNYWHRQEGLNKHVLALEIGGLLEIISRLGLDADIVDRGRQEKQKRLLLYAPDVWERSDT